MSYALGMSVFSLANLGFSINNFLIYRKIISSIPIPTWLIFLNSGIIILATVRDILIEPPNIEVNNQIIKENKLIEIQPELKSNLEYKEPTESTKILPESNPDPVKIEKTKQRWFYYKKKI